MLRRSVRRSLQTGSCIEVRWASGPWRLELPARGELVQRHAGDELLVAQPDLRAARAVTADTGSTTPTSQTAAHH